MPLAGGFSPSFSPYGSFAGLGQQSAFGGYPSSFGQGLYGQQGLGAFGAYGYGQQRPYRSSGQVASPDQE